MQPLPILLPLALAAAASLPQAQVLTDVDGAAVAPGTQITLRGAGLTGTTHARFHAYVGGFVGTWIQDAPVVSVTDSAVTVVVPDMIGGWVHEGPSAGSPEGLVQTVLPSGTSNTLPFYFFEGSNGFLDNAGLGTTQTSGQGRSIVSFDYAGGAPTPGNPSFQPTLHNAEPGAFPFLAAGLPSAPLPFDDGLLAMNLGAIFVISPGTPVDALGNASIGALPMPPIIPSGVQIAMQWGYLDPATSAFEISNALIATY